MNSSIANDVRAFTDYTQNLDEFLVVDADKAAKFKSAAKFFYDTLKKLEDVEDTNDYALPDLLINGFDDEQIYQQIQLHFNGTNGLLMKNITKLITNSDRLTFNVPTSDPDASSSAESADDMTDLKLNDNEVERSDVEDDADHDEENEEEDEDEDEEEEEMDHDKDEEHDEDDNENQDKSKMAKSKTLIKSSKNLFDDDEPDEDELNEQSTLEKRQAKLKEKIDQIHDSMLDNLNNKPWQLKGEVSAKTRPQESLIEEYLQFEHTTKQMPLNTVELTKKIESLIKTRIKDRAFDDVERKIKPVDQPNEYKKEVTLNHEKSKISLSQVYEQQYLEANKAKGEQQAEKVNPAHEDIRTALQSLFIKLDALSNFHFKPKPQINDFKIKSNIATISVENVAPVNVSNTSMLAPSEIHASVNKLPKTSAEKDKREKKRDYKAKRQTLKKINKKNKKSKDVSASDKQQASMKNVKKLSNLKPNKTDANATLQVFNPSKQKDKAEKKKPKFSTDNLSAKRLKI